MPSNPSLQTGSSAPPPSMCIEPQCPEGHEYRRYSAFPPRKCKPPATPSDWAGRRYHEARQIVLDRFEVEFAKDALSRANGVMLRAAELAGMARSSFYRMVEKHGIRTPEA